MRYIFIFLMFLSATSQAAYLSGFGDVSINGLDWDKGTEDKSPKRDFIYLELEGAAQYDWGDLYGFFDFENPGKTGDDTRTALKGSINHYIAGTKWGLYAQVYNFAAAGFSDQNRVLGLSYTFSGPGWWFKPFLGFHNVSQTFYSGSNGYMGGWVGGYFFDVGTQKFLVADWHEYEFARNEAYANGNGGRRESHNGALSVWWLGPQSLSLGLQWRYATDKLGTMGAMNAMIYSVKYNLD